MDLASTVLLCLLPGAIGVDRIETLDGEVDAERYPAARPQLDPGRAGGASKPAPCRQSWDVTSDTIAAWIAGQLKAQSLVLLKSASLPARRHPRAGARGSKLVDPFFPLISSALPRVEYLNLRDPVGDARGSCRDRPAAT